MSAYSSAHPAQPLDARAAATVSLLAVALVAVSGMRLSVPPGTASRPATATVAPTERVPVAPVKIVGASPRSEACDAQVWPYIEGRCLVRAPAPAAPPAETTAAVPPPPPAAARAETIGAAPAARPPAAIDDRAPLRTAASQLQLPPRRAAATSASDAWIDDDVAQPSYGTQSRRSGRRGYRDERRRRHAFPFFFR
jgi:hypothetical protein